MSLVDLLPKELLGLPEPWRATNDFRRAQAAEQLPIEPATIETSLGALARVLHALTQLSRPETLPLPEEAKEAYGFAVLGISKHIPVLDELTEQPFIEWLADALDRAPHAIELLALVQAWTYSVCAGISHTVLMWLTNHTTQVPHEQRLRLVAIASDVWAKLEDDLASTLLTTVSGVAREDALELLAVVENQGGTPEIRAVAKRYREWTATRSDQPG